jgi:hypothetical protein
VEIGFTPRFIFHHAPEPTCPVISLKQWGGILTAHMCFSTLNSHEKSLTAILCKVEPRENVHFSFTADETRGFLLLQLVELPDLAFKAERYME